MESDASLTSLIGKVLQVLNGEESFGSEARYFNNLWRWIWPWRLQKHSHSHYGHLDYNYQVYIYAIVCSIVVMGYTYVLISFTDPLHVGLRPPWP